MQMITTRWIGAAASDEDFLAIARGLLESGDPGALANILAFARQHPGLWTSGDGVDLLTDLLARLIDMLAERRIADALSAIDLCPADLAQQAIDLLLIVFLPDDEDADPGELDNAATLCLALLIGSSGRRAEAVSFIDDAALRRVDEDFGLDALVIRSHFAPVAGEGDFKCKLVIWDLDDTLWRGTLADGDDPVLDEHRAAFVRAFNRHGIVSAICSKNDHAAAREKLESFGLWDEFVFPRIAFLPKGEVVNAIIADMRLRPANVLFIDDNVRNLREVEAASPGITVIDATSPECDELLDRILDRNRHVAKSRVDEYRMLEARIEERRGSMLTDEAFLRRSGIEASYTHRMDNLDFAGRIEELINRSNQLNYTASRVEPGSMRDIILNVSDYDVFSAFVWDRYGYYGLVGVAVFDKRSHCLLHFAFSCRIMHMGVEDFLFRALCERYDRVGLRYLRKPLPTQSSAAIALRPFEAPEVRARILAQESPRDWSKVRLRLMCDCQSGAFHHYSRFREAMDFDNIPRIFSLPMMLTGEHEQQSFPDFLVYTPATDYMDWRWEALMPAIDPAAYVDAARRFEAMIVAGGHRVLLILPPEDASDAHYDVIQTATPQEMRARNRQWNALWRDMAARHPTHVHCIDLTGQVAEEDMVVHAYHYAPSTLRRIAGMIDDWYEAQPA